MIKKLLNKFFKHITFKYEREVVEKYLSDTLSQRSYDETQYTFNASKAANSYDLEQRIHKLDKVNKYRQFYM